jgi:triphosphoribosyl-dephospho-CoA synthetase
MSAIENVERRLRRERSWQNNRAARDARIAEGARFACGKIVEGRNATHLLEAVIRPCDRVCLEGDNQKQADLLSRALLAVDLSKVTAQGFPSVYRIGLPALRSGASANPDDPEAARVEACFALIASVEDTNLLHRGGLEGLYFAHRKTRQFPDAGGVRGPGWRARAISVHESFVARRLSPGGSADLLAMTLFVETDDRPGL